MGVGLSWRQRFMWGAAAATLRVLAALRVLLNRLWCIGTAFVGRNGTALAAGHGRQARRAENHPRAGPSTPGAAAGLVTLGHWPQLGEITAVGAVVFVDRHRVTPLHHG